MNSTHFAEERLINIHEVVELIGLSRSTIYVLVSAGKFPKPLKLTERRVAWRNSDIASWVQDRLSPADAL